MKKLLVTMLAAAILAGCAGPSQREQANPNDSIAAAEHWVPSASAIDGKPLKIYVREKRAKGGDASSFATSGKVVLLAHGAGTPGSVAFDLQVPAPTVEFRTVTPENSRGLFEAPASDPAAIDAWVKAVAQWGSKAPNRERRPIAW